LLDTVIDQIGSVTQKTLDPSCQRMERKTYTINQNEFNNSRFKKESSMKNMKFFLQLFLMALFLSSCSAILLQSEKENLKKIKIGSTQEEVINLMGTPERVTYSFKDVMLKYIESLIVLENNQVIYTSSPAGHWNLHVEVESFVGDLPKKRIAKILPSKKGVTSNDLEFLSIKRVISKSLSEKGYSVSENDKTIDTIVFVNYGISDPKVEVKTWSEPVYDYVATPSQQSSQTTHQLYNQYGQNLGQVQSTTNHGNPYAVNMPQPVYRGERMQQETLTTYNRYLIMEAVDFHEFKINKADLKYYWKVTTTSEGKSNNLTEKIPYLASISTRYIEKNSNGKQKGTIWDNDPRAIRLLSSDK